MTSNAVSPQAHPFLTLERSLQSSLTHKVSKDFESKSMKKKEFGKCYQSALNFMIGRKTILSEAEKEVLEALNTGAEEEIHYRPSVTAWKEVLPRITDLGSYLELSGKIALRGSVLVGGIGLFYLRSHKLIALACGCMACSLLIFRSSFLKLSHASRQLREIVEQLTPHNFDQFASQVDGVYTELKKTNYLMRCYLTAQEKKRTPKDHQGLQLLKEQLAALCNISVLISFCNISAICNISALISLLLPKANRSSLEDEELLEEIPDCNNLSKIKNFFERFQRLCQSGERTALGIGVLALAWTYYAYVQRAYLMVAAGIVHCVVQAMIVKELDVLQRGSGKIKNAMRVKSEFQSMAQHSFLLSCMELQQASVEKIQDVVVIPFDAVLKLIPFWKTIFGDESFQ